MSNPYSTIGPSLLQHKLMNEDCIVRNWIALGVLIEFNLFKGHPGSVQRIFNSKIVEHELINVSSLSNPYMFGIHKHKYYS